MEAPPVQYATTSDGVSIAWAEAGQGPALLQCPPTPFSHVLEEYAVWGAVYGAFTRTFRLVTFDARGTGMSERDVAGVSAETLLLDAQAVTDAAKLDRFIGLALGGNLLAISTCLRLATAFPERVSHVVLESPVQNFQEVADTPLGRTSFVLAEADWTVFTQTLVRVVLGWDVASSGFVDRLAKVIGGWVDPAVGLRYMREVETMDVGDLLAQVSQPTLVLRNDPYYVPVRCSQRIAAKIRGAQFRQYSDPTHTQQAELIRAFVAQSSPPLPQEWPAASPFRTILFTDIEGSTALTQRLGDAKAQEILHTHNVTVRDALKAHGGSEIKHTGDGIMASFTSASRALEAAVVMQKAFADHNSDNTDTVIRVRIGLNAGEPVAEEEDLFGTAVQLAARVCAQAEPGQILAADVVQQLAAGKGFTFIDKGEAGLKGFEKPVRLHEVVWD